MAGNKARTGVAMGTESQIQSSGITAEIRTIRKIESRWSGSTMQSFRDLQGMNPEEFFERIWRKAVKRNLNDDISQINDIKENSIPDKTGMSQVLYLINSLVRSLVI